ncbi:MULTISPECIES: phosphate ABC transporter substrate-binding protein [unclassified Shewanella]|uniref:phosphate ABC transporter substrate-binding protein n=1 Tax=unclassified Shewanella TaxID=196818 RepID=UPI000C846C51|nr:MULTISPECIES: phosphate ABC transporter substrate-binding protein [unclassified Shewanella]MDO6618882.1 phosphate ABC transporter substrate-binding protein [Shewanella sp. 6_MG-2023]MDO6640435.1 phosphate ABC transporter substrate-binding protein [Shewanella sp. 5_MG-2023]MDO6677897.1 phosphate ABC transporter substrate-binding protein [Shewanella sp. 4_MG-2023]MDO6775275.1 phosphate ABC transporter substrate-binding protein [Shewanella sp. 3_MG-2023]PMG29644.1 phosphate ABC transporter sub
MKKLLSILALSVSCVFSVNAAVVVIGNPAAADISKSDAKKAFLGKGSSFVVYELEEGNPIRSEFHSAVTGKSDAQLKAFWSKQVFTGKGTPPATIGDASGMKAAIAADANAIGYIDEADVDGSVKVILKP